LAAHVLRSPERAYRESREELLERLERVSSPTPPADCQARLNAAAERLLRIRAREAISTIDLPLVRIARSFRLTQDEQDVLLLAAASALDPKFARDWHEVDSDLMCLNVGLAIAVLAKSFEDGVGMRRIFGTNAPLIENSLLLLDKGNGRSEGNLLELDLSVPRRVVGELLGHSVIDGELVAFSSLRRSQVKLAQVVLPESTKALVLGIVAEHPTFLERRKAWGIDTVVTYGRGMVLLFVGPPGTGKTMLANAVAHELDKPLFCVDLAKLVEAGRTFEANLDAAFREARLLDAVLFFDECEQVFAARQFGNSHIPALLTRLETFDGVAILATNMPNWLDGAVLRRTVAQIDFRAPTPSERADIWRCHLPEALPRDPDVSVEDLAQDFELSGGYIKNAVLTAVMHATARGADSIAMSDLVHGARLQVRVTGEEDEEDCMLRPEATLDDVVLPADVRRRLTDFIAAAKVRSTVLNEWGFGRTLGRATGLAAMLSGPPGTGKSMTAELPTEAPVAPDVDCLALGRAYELSGGLIRNAVQFAALEAASLPRGERRITQAMLERAGRLQLNDASPTPYLERAVGNA
jgi:broad-specificity NMP kinase